ncbi:MAG: amidase, partial [Acetobacteraceae bacterium]|nr:amidase [Acetobacteraceae bacterium]
MSDELIRLSATEAAARLKAGDITPLDLIDAAEARIAAVDGDVNALPTLCLD